MITRNDLYGNLGTARADLFAFMKGNPLRFSGDGHSDAIFWDSHTPDTYWAHLEVSHRACIDLIVDGFNADNPAPVPAPQMELPVTVLTQADVDRAVAEALRDVAKKASRIANHAGYCNEYDRIAEGVGLPTRDDLYYREHTHTVDVTVTFSITMNGEEDPDWSTSDIEEELINYSLSDGNVSGWEISYTEEGRLIDHETGEEISD
jgi:hypothetical protein